ncbi:MAG: ribbon-helix-helix protein, CopG family [Geobacteraceae bacterium]|nr:ribbon-helix-helix protein, CopG family [Geobacteraceae bacterium]
MKPTSVRLTDSEREALELLAAKQGTTVSALVRMAAMKLAQASGAQRRQAGTTLTTITLWPFDREALVSYMQRNDFDTMAEAAGAAMRVGLQHRGYLQPETDTTYDQEWAIK